MRLTDKKKQYFADVSLVVFAILQGAAFVAGKDALNSITPMFLLAFRFGIAALILYGFMFKWIGKLTREDIKNGVVVGTVLFAAYAAQTYGLKYTTASKQGFMLTTYVVMVPFLYWLIHKKRPQIRVVVGSVITIVAIYLISLQETLSLEIGDVLTLVGAFLFAAHILFLEHFTKHMNVFKLAFMQMVMACFLSTTTALLTEPIPFEISSRIWLSLLFLGVFSTFICFTIQTVAQKYTSSSHASIIMSTESVFAAIMGVLILGEVMTKNVIIGCCMIFVAVLIIELDVKLFRKSKSEAIPVENV
ncbi:MAG: DMT family transporter [Clostridiales bacterium]|nr:DMT family transporter [Clostridiales bacterium]